MLLFGGLTLYAVLEEPTWSVIGVRLCVDSGLLLIVLVSMAVGRPFTLQYAREQVAREFWGGLGTCLPGGGHGGIRSAVRAQPATTRRYHRARLGTRRRGQVHRLVSRTHEQGPNHASPS